MSEVPKIIEDFLKGNNDAGGTVAKLEEYGIYKLYNITTVIFHN